MIRQPYPTYSPTPHGLACKYTLDFNADNNHIINLLGTWQGDSVRAISLYINNYNSPDSIYITNNSFTFTVAPFTAGSISIKNFDYIRLNCDAGVIEVSVLNYVNDYTFTSRGIAPAGLVSDPYWSYVSALYHFNSYITTKAAKNDCLSSISFGDLNFIKTSDERILFDDDNKFFGETSLNFAAGVKGNYAESAKSSVINSANLTIEFKFYVPTSPGSYQSEIFRLTNNTASRILYFYASGGRINIDDGATTYTFSHGSFAATGWYTITFTFINNGVTLYIDGVGSAASGAITFNEEFKLLIGSKVGDIRNYGGFNIDEMRISNLARYTNNYTPRDREFFSEF